uniref:Serrate RNA effector molecule homolog n=1 Tax=Gadus morhua TaxID=8049 RepID=A0A8C5CVU4_GADMO
MFSVCRDDHRGEPYRGGYDMPYGGGGPPFPGGPGHPGWHPELPNMHPHHPGHPLQGRVDETEAVKRYNQYKLDFRRQQLQDFFITHKEHEFRMKYHPEDMVSRRAESQAALKSRMGVFLFLLENGWLDNMSLDMEHAPKIIKLLDAAVIKMEGGTDHDLQVLELPVSTLVGGEGPVGGGGGGGGDGGGSSVAAAPVATGTPGTKPDTEKRKRSSGSADSADGSGSDSDSSHSDDPDRCVCFTEGGERHKERQKEREKAGPPKPRPLHLTTSLFMRSIAPDVCREELGALCRRYPGFLRVALSDPQPERRFFRRCWVTFDRSVNIKEICWNLQNIRLKDCELAPVVNRDLSRRVRSVNGLTHHKPVVRNDIKLSARLVHALDQKGSLWGEESNPVLKNITDYLIEEVSAEEEELTGVTGGNEAGDGKDPSDVTVETDETLLKVLDRLLVYLRLVHSVDYYNLCEYPAEDEMPHRCGLIHVRGPAPLGNITTAEVGEHQKMCEERLAVLLTSSESLSDEEAARLGKKDPDHEVEKFLVANTQELGKDKWLCPLSGKKFKAPEFVRKHILNKHGDKVTAVRQEVEFFNNFLLDAKRPALPENKPPPPPVQAPPPGLQVFPGQTPQQHSLLGYPPGVRPPMQGFPGAGPPYPPNQFGGGRGNYDNFRGHGSGFPGKQRNNSRGVRGDPRSIIEYRDLDAPEDLDFF